MVGSAGLFGETFERTLPHRGRHRIGVRRSRPCPDAREDPGRSQQERDTDATQHRLSLPVADRRASRLRRLLTESSPLCCVAGVSRTTATRAGAQVSRGARIYLVGEGAATRDEWRSALCGSSGCRSYSGKTWAASANSAPLMSVPTCGGQASNPILALGGEGKNEDAKSRPGRDCSLPHLTNASCVRIPSPLSPPGTA